jgi:hypothetical protein
MKIALPSVFPNAFIPNSRHSIHYNGIFQLLVVGKLFHMNRRCLKQVFPYTIHIAMGMYIQSYYCWMDYPEMFDNSVDIVHGYEGHARVGIVASWDDQGALLIIPGSQQHDRIVSLDNRRPQKRFHKCIDAVLQMILTPRFMLRQNECALVKCDFSTASGRFFKTEYNGSPPKLPSIRLEST